MAPPKQRWDFLLEMLDVHYETAVAGLMKHDSCSRPEAGSEQRTPGSREARIFDYAEVVSRAG
ncbi:MAG: hypothetical protein KF760_29825 [Candidatus Eremiobacteraeota bacterium]|nr:hypothetical protein [Candidatus Eremiobacteraeota bacterium]MCW5866918.1 hypothetical protein [Candidatus Eremiobacteraeota bacterium]